MQFTIFYWGIQMPPVMEKWLQIAWWNEYGNSLSGMESRTTLVACKKEPSVEMWLFQKTYGLSTSTTC